jgi:hypothetical protein
LYVPNGDCLILEVKARCSPYLESSLITRGGPRSVLAVAALRFAIIYSLL